MGCGISVPTNPVSELLISTLGDNFYPPGDLNFQPGDRGKLANEPLLQMVQPGGGKIKPPANPNDTHISEIIAPIAGAIGAIFSFFGPLFIILDVIRAIIDIICAMFNPFPLIMTVVDLFINVLPPLVALYPPFASVLHAINVAKLMTAIVGGIMSSMVPILDSIVQCTLEIPIALSAGRIDAADTLGIKICGLIQEMTNIIAGFTPISFIIEILRTFMSLGSKFFCVGSPVGDSPCCTTENCPPVIINPPGGTGIIIHTIDRFSVKDLIGAIIDVAINLPLRFISDFVNSLVEAVFSIIDKLLSIINDNLDPINSGIDKILDIILKILEFIDNPLISLDDLINEVEDIRDLEFGGISLADLNLPTIGILDLEVPHPDIFNGIVLTQPSMYLELTSAKSQSNENGLISSVGLGHNYTDTEISTLHNYIIDPEKIPSPEPKVPGFLRGESEEERNEEESSVTTMKVKISLPGSTFIGRLQTSESIRIISNQIGTMFDPVVQPVNVVNVPSLNSKSTSITSVLLGPVFNDLSTITNFNIPTSPANAIIFKTPGGLNHPAFANEVQWADGFVPENYGDYTVDYTSGGITIFNGPFSVDEIQSLDENREVVLQYYYRSSLEGISRMVDAKFVFPTTNEIAAAVGLGSVANSNARAPAVARVRKILDDEDLEFVPTDALGIIHVSGNYFPSGTQVDYEILPNSVELLKHNLIGLGCQNDIQVAAQTLTDIITAEDGSGAEGTLGFDSLIDKLGGEDIPDPPVKEFEEIIKIVTDDPGAAGTVDPIAIGNNFIELVDSFVGNVVCVGSNGLASEFESSKAFVLANSSDFSLLSLKIKDQGGNDLLVGGLLPNSDFGAKFTTTFGTIGPVEFISESGTFFAPISSDVKGSAVVTAEFIFNKKPCTRAREIVNLVVQDQEVNIEFVPEKTSHPRTRRQPQYVHSRGGRARR